MAKYEDKVKEGHSYDGIDEYDNPMPGWWKNLFWATIVFSIFYCGYYMLGSGPSALDEYAAEVEEIELAKAKVSEEKASSGVSLSSVLITASLDPTKVEAGKATFVGKCAACHGAQGQGVIGPNLTDAKWIHGGDLESIYRVVSEGVLEKGMIAWKGQLSDDQMAEVVAYIRSIQDTNVAGKAPEGEISSATELVIK